MIKPETRQLLEEMGKSRYGIALQEFLDEEFDLINDIQTCQNFEEMLGRQKALATLERLFGFMRERKTSTKEKNPYV